MLFGGVINENIYATEFADAFFDGAFAKALITVVSFDKEAFSALGLDEFFGFVGIAIGVIVTDADVGAFAGKVYSYRGPMPESPPVMSAILPLSLSAPL